MKSSKKAKLLRILIPIVILIALMGFVLAGNSNTDTQIKEKAVTRPHSSVILKQQVDTPTKVDVYLGMADNSSVASFQIGLEVDIADNYDTSFDWASNLNDGTENYKEYRILKESNLENYQGKKRINIYYTGTKELNQLKGDKEENTVDVDNVKVGTITFNYVKGEDQNPINTESSTILVEPIGDGTESSFTKTVSLSHKANIVPVEEDDILRTTTEGPYTEEPEEPGPQQPEGETSNPNTPGSGTTTPSTPEGGTSSPSTPDVGTDNPETTPNTPEGETPKPSTPGSETDNPETTTPNTPEGETPKPSTPGSETNNPETTAPSTPEGETPNQGTEGGTTQPEATTPGTSTTETPQPQTSATPEQQTSENSQSGSIINKIVNAMKTGGNRSNVWVIVLLVILVVIAVAIIFIKSKGKHSRH